MEFQFPEALCKLIAAGYKNVRIDHSLLLELGQKSFLTGDIRYLFVDLHDVFAPEETAGSGGVEVRDELGENARSIMFKIVIYMEECVFHLFLWNLRIGAGGDRLVVSATRPIYRATTIFPFAECAAVTAHDFTRKSVGDI